ncbi:MAG: efflux RND transporter permease subunit [Bacteroidales bacterium]|jgi:multidrug efflux pump subunit AcrB|nr:efflux RND transporter permease subunit [Bacteroidales bacterium]
MRKIINLFISYPFYANLIIAIVSIGGFFAINSMKLSFFPEISSRIIIVNVQYLGASPIEMEEGVTSLVEEAIHGIAGIKEVTSRSRENSARISIEITGTVDIDEVLIEVKNAVDGIAGFPSGAERPSIYKVRNTSRAYRFAILGDVDILTLKKHTEQIEDELLQTGQISQIEIWNNPTIELAIEIKEEQLLRYNITFDEIAQAVEMNNRDLSAGELRNNSQEMLIRLRSRTTDPEILKNIVIRGNETGAIVRLKDIATVEKRIIENYYPTRINGKQALYINVEKLNTEDLQTITEVCDTYIEKFNTSHSDVQLTVLRRRLDPLFERLDMVLENGFLGLLLVVLSLSLFLSFKLSLWVAWGIPFSFLAMFIIGNFMGVTINMISLFGMILVIGILVDDGIVIGENIYSHFERGKTPARAAIDGTMEVLPAITTSISTTIVAFSPLLFLVGGHMEMMVEMAIIVILCLALSLIEAFFILPAHLSSPRILDKKSLENKGVKKHIDTLFQFLRSKIYDRYIRWAIRWRYVVIIGTPILFTLITLGLFRGEIIQTTIFPHISFDDFNINIAFTPGSGSGETYEYIEKVERAVEETSKEFTEKYQEYIIAKYDSLIPIIDNYSSRVGYAFDGEEVGAHAGMVDVSPIELEGIPVASEEIAQSIQEKLGKLPEVKKYSVGAHNRWGAPISISVMSRDIEKMQETKEMLIKELSTYNELKDVKENNPLGKREIKIKLKDKAHFLGLSEVFIASQIRQGFYGEQVQRIQEGRNEIRVWLKYPAEDRMYIGQLEDIKIKTKEGEIPLSELISITIERGPVAIQRLDGKRETRIEAEMTDPKASVTNIIARIQEEVLTKVQEKYPGVYLNFEGQAKFGKEVGASISKGFALAFTIIIIILLIHFRNTGQVIIVILIIPLAAFGSIWGHIFHDKIISLMSLHGIIALTGVIINDSVVFLSRYNDYVREGNSIYESTILAGKSRLRAILLTSLTTTAGLMPIIFETSIQAQFLIPMAISLAYGVLFGTIFLLLLFPVMIIVANDIRRVIAYIRTGEKKSREDVDVNNIEKSRITKLES